MPYVVIVLFIVAAVAIIGVGLYLEYKRRQMWLALGRQYGLRYIAGDTNNLTLKTQFQLFDQGHSKRVSNSLVGDYQGVPVVIFDFTYKTGSGKNQSTHNISGVLARQEVGCTGLCIRPESFLDRFASFLGFEDINFESEQFNRAFKVTSDDKKFAYDICHAGMLEFLLQFPDLTWELRGREVLLYSWTMGTFDPEEVAVCLRALTGFVERIPAYLRQK